MNNNLAIMKSQNFGEVRCDIYQGNSDEIFMTINQLAEALEYADRSGVQKILNRNIYLKSEEFSVRDKLYHPAGGTQDVIFFTEDGIYEVTMLSSQPKAKLFRSWMRQILKAMRNGELKPNTADELKAKRLEIMLKNANTRLLKEQTSKINSLIKIASNYSGAYKQVLESHAVVMLTGEQLLPLPQTEQKTYSATEIGEKLGISSQKVGVITNAHGLKTPEYGRLFIDKSKYSNKEVETFRYFDNIIPVIRKILEK